MLQEVSNKRACKIYESRYWRYSVKLLFGLSLFDQHRPTGQQLLPRTTVARQSLSWPLSTLYLPKKHTMDHRVRRKMLAEIIWGWIAPQNQITH